jgi:hypothetical protein
MTKRLADKVALVLGAGSIGPGWGNGKATAVAFAREGAKVVCVDIDVEAAQDTAKLIADEDGVALALRRRRDAERRHRPNRRHDARDVRPDRHSRQQCRHRRDGRRRRDRGGGVGSRLRRQPEELLSGDEARHPGDGRAGRRGDRQYLLDRLDPLHGRALWRPITRPRRR